MDTVGAHIKAARQKAGLSQEELAGIVKTTKSTISKYENGLRQPRIEQLQAIAAALGVSVGSLLGYEEEQVIIPGRLKIVSVNDPELENIQYRIEAEDEETFNLGCKIMEDAGVHIPAHTPAGRISAALEKLNDKGQSVAVERVEELTKIPDYQRTAQPPEPTQEATEDKK